MPCLPLSPAGVPGLNRAQKQDALAHLYARCAGYDPAAIVRQLRAYRAELEIRRLACTPSIDATMRGGSLADADLMADLSAVVS